MNQDLKGKNALVCGSTSGIGNATARLLAQRGANVILMARNEEKLQKAVGELEAGEEQSHSYLVADFHFPGQVEKAAASLRKNGKTVHILVNNTGGPPGGGAFEASQEEYKQAFASHLLCNHALVQALVPGMKEAGYGRIINVISTSVKIPLDGLGVSNTVRGAVANWSKTLANELGRFHISVNNVLPGATRTPRLESIIANKSKKSGRSPEEVEKAMTDSIPMKRFADPGELAQAICFLASPAASYINGVNLPVDGGRTGSL